MSPTELRHDNLKWLAFLLRCEKVRYLARWRTRHDKRIRGGRAKPAKKVAVACQGGGIHASFTVGVLSEILGDIQAKRRFKLIGLSGTSAVALCALMAWYGLAHKGGR